MRLSSGLVWAGAGPAMLPGPSGWRGVLDTARLLWTPLPVFEAGHQRFGDVVAYRMANLRLVLVNDPDAVHHVLVRNARNYRKSPFYRVLRPVLGHGLVTSDGELWRKQRKLAQPAFHHQRLEGFAQIMVEVTTNLLDRWESIDPGEPVDMHAQMLSVTLRAVGHTLFSTELGAATEEIYGALESVLRRANDIVASFLTPKWLPTTSNRDFHRALAKLDRIVLEMIARRRRAGRAGDDLLGMLMAATDEETDHTMSDQQLRDEVMTLFIAGHETVANALSWALMLLAQHPQTTASLVDEIDEVLGDRPPSFSDLPALERTERVVMETMRLYPPAWIVERQAIGPDTIAGYPLPAKTLVTFSIYCLHRHPGLWRDPLRFDPSRFNEQRCADRHRFAYLPFGAGPRRCIGNAFAMMEAKIMLAMIFQRYRPRLATRRPIELDPGITLRPRGGISMLVEPRA